MPRKATAVIALLLVAACVVAIVRAQESSRRRASLYRSPSDITAPLATESPAAEPGLMPLNDSAPALLSGSEADGETVPAAALGRRRSGTLQDRLRASSRSLTDDSDPTAAEPPAIEYSGEPALLAAPAANEAAQGGPYSIPTETAPPTNSTHSVLKRGRFNATAEPAPEMAQPAAAMPEMASPAPTIRRVPSQPLAGGSARRSSPGQATDEPSIQDLTITSHNPQLRVDVVGPQSISVGKLAGYVINVMNEGEVPAADVQVRMDIPGFVAVKESDASSGQPQLLSDPNGTRLVWSVPRVEARSHQTLRIKLIASEGEPFDLAVEWICRPTVARAPITVRQPRLELSLAGPGDMTFGEEKLFTLTVSNPGTGLAENVSVSLSSGGAAAQAIEVGSIPAGQQKEIPVQVVATQAGEMELKATARGDGSLAAEAAGKVLVKQAQLALAVAGPSLKYAGTEATYVLTVANRGNAVADGTTIAVELPEGAQYVGGIDDASAGTGGVKFKVGALSAGSERTFELHCQLNAAGVNRVTAEAHTKSGGTATAMAETQVEAVADIKLVVNDPAGASPVGSDIEYELQVMNRGTQAAQQVRIVMQFSEGMEPTEFSGGQAKIVPGQVVCEPLPLLEAGEQVIVKVKARAGRAGTHQYRVEVTGLDPGTRAVSEGTTKFYADSGNPAAAAARTATKPNSRFSTQR